LSHVGLPALLVPYPFAADDHQTANARVFEKAGAAVLTPERDLDAKTIREMLVELNESHLESMSKSMKDLADPDAAAQIANVIEG
jgi:UDP-N-acetylglucosamine--N-acetylmuramyl-(pentapeptide) pyrophosphoryl-undecaprenol N-acetylglucosamine transferase